MKIKTPNERDTADLLELVCQLHSRALAYPSKEMHDSYIEARRVLERRIGAIKTSSNPVVSSSNWFERLPLHWKLVYYMVGGIIIGWLANYCC